MSYSQKSFTGLMLKSAVLVLALAATPTLADDGAKSQPKRETPSLNGYAGGFFGYQQTSFDVLDGRMPLGGFIGMKSGDLLRFGLYALLSFGDGGNEILTYHYLYGGDASIQLGPLYLGGSAGLSMLMINNLDEAETSSKTGFHFGPIAGIDFPIREDKDITLGAEGRLLFHPAGGISTRSYQALLLGVTLKAWFNW